VKYLLSPAPLKENKDDIASYCLQTMKLHKVFVLITEMQRPHNEWSRRLCEVTFIVYVYLGSSW